MPLDHMTIMKACYENERKRVLDKARELARELESSAKMIAKAAEEGDLNRIAWLTRTHDAELSTRSTVLHENLHMIAGLEAQRATECYQDPNAKGARCAVHGTVPDWSGELSNYKGPAGWICSEGGRLKDAK